MGINQGFVPQNPFLFLWTTSASHRHAKTHSPDINNLFLNYMFYLELRLLKLPLDTVIGNGDESAC